MENEQTTLRDELSSAFDAAEQGTLQPVPDAPPVVEAEPVVETAEQKAGRTAGRQRDEKGRLLPGKPVKDAAPEPKPDGGLPTAEAQPAPVVAPKVQRPSSWKKDHWEAFDKLANENPALAAYINQREQEYSKGVSTYKQEWEQAKPLLDAVAPFMPQLQQAGIDPGQWVSNLGNAHQRLVTSSPQEKLAMFQKLAADYGVPAQLAVQDQQGQWQLLGQLPQPQQQPQVPVQQIVRQMLQEERLNSEVEQFWSDPENKFPHREQVRSSMVGLLQSGLVNDLPSAYEAALRLPQHSDIYEAQQQQQRQQDAEKAKAAERAKAEAAQRRSISPRTSSPAGAIATGAKGLRDELSEQFDAHVSGRV